MSKKRKSKDASDPQKAKLYPWEHQWIDWNRKQISLADCKNLIAAACQQYGVDSPTVMAGGAEWSASGYFYEHGCIALLNEHQNISSALHEAAHVITLELAPRAQDHGPLFVGVFFYLLTAGGWYPKEAVYASARKAGIKWSKKATPEDLRD